MAPSTVYFTNLRAKPGDNRLQKLRRLMEQAGMGNFAFQDQFVAIQIPFAEPGNLY